MNYAIMYGLEPADRIIKPIFTTGLSKHHVIFLGMDQNGTEWISENDHVNGVRVIAARDFFARNKSFRIQKFTGGEVDRQLAVQRALSDLGKPYNLFQYNCEHHAEFVQHNRIFSGQVEAVREFIGKAGLVLLAVAVISLFIKD